MQSAHPRAYMWLLRAASATALAASCLAASNADAYVVRQTTSGTPVHWPVDSVALEVDPSVVNAVDGALEAAQMAAAAWTLAAAGPRVSVSAATSASTPAIDGRNVVYLVPGYARAGAALAVTLVSYDDTTGEIVDADIVLNGSYAFALLAADAKAGAAAMSVANEPASTDEGAAWAGALGAGGEDGRPRFDLVHVLSHETGHVLGLRDAVSDSEDLMYLYTLAGDASKRAPAADDVAGVTFLYSGVPVTAGHGCTAAPEPPRGVDPLVLLWALALLVVWHQRRVDRQRRQVAVARPSRSLPGARPR